MAKKKRNRTQASKKKRKQVFHAPQTYGEKLRIPMTPVLHSISAVSLAVQLGLTAFAIFAASFPSAPSAVMQYGIPARVFFPALSIVGWILTLGFRLACRFLPLDMWRLPASVRKGMKLTQGQPLKLITLLVELETAIAFVYICVSIYLGYAPMDAVLLLWIAALIVSIYLPCRKARRIAAGEIVLPVSDNSKEQ